jgi:hypothetical protein
VGFDILLRDNLGNTLDRVGDPTEILHRLFYRRGEQQPDWLSYVDPYGDTVFNRPQITVVLDELNELLASATTDEERKLLLRIVDMANQVERGVHLYLKFLGD